MVEGKTDGAQGDGVQVLEQALEEEGGRLARGFRTLICLSHCPSAPAKEAELTSVGLLVVAEEVVVVVEVEAGLVTLVRRISQIPMVLMSPNTSKLVLQSQSLESHAGPSQLLSKSSLTI